jgi:hypothetical protein
VGLATPLNAGVIRALSALKGVRALRTAAILSATAVLGTGLVYVPYLLVDWVSGSDFGWLGTTFITVAMPVVAWMICQKAWRFIGARPVGCLIPCVLVPGLWVASPILLLVRGLLSEDRDISSWTSLLSPEALAYLALSSATYQGTLFGLVASSVVVWFPSWNWEHV